LSEQIIVYGTPTCPMVPPVLGMLKQANAPHDYINIRQDQAGLEHVRAINGGDESVPTLVFPDGTTLTEPGEAELRAKLTSLGYRVPWTAWLIGNAWKLLIGAAVLFALARMIGLF
jgi:mycoredoxin